MMYNHFVIEEFVKDHVWVANDRQPADSFRAGHLSHLGEVRQEREDTLDPESAAVYGARIT